MPVLGRNKKGAPCGKNIRSAEARKKGDKFIYAIREQLGGRPHAFTGPCMMSGQFWYAFAHKVPDADAYTKEIMDRLTDAGIWVDDTQLIQAPALVRMGPMYPGHVDLEIWEVNDDQEI